MLNYFLAERHLRGFQIRPFSAQHICDTFPDKSRIYRIYLRRLPVNRS